MTQDAMKKAAALAALDYIEYDDIIGVGTGSTVNFFIEGLAKMKGKIDGAVASSKATEDLLKANGIRVLDLNQTGTIPIYIDGADEATSSKHLIKGGGGALTREKIVAEVAEKFICIIDESKLVDILGAFPLPVEVIPMAQSLVARKLITITGTPSLRESFKTDNGNIILDLGNAKILNPVELEKQINNIPGVVCNGLFAIRAADELIIAKKDGTLSTL